LNTDNFPVSAERLKFANIHKRIVRFEQTLRRLDSRKGREEKTTRWGVGARRHCLAIPH